MQINLTPPAHHLNAILFKVLIVIAITATAGGLLKLNLIINAQRDVFVNKSFVGNTDVSLLSKADAIQKIYTEIGEEKVFPIIVSSDQEEIASSSSQLGYKLQIEESVEKAFAANHQNFSLTKPTQLLNLLTKTKVYSLESKVDEEQINSLAQKTAEKINVTGHAPAADLKKSGNEDSLSIDSGKIGYEIDVEELKKELKQALSQHNSYQDIKIRISPKQTFTQLSELETEQALSRAKKLVGTEVSLYSQEYRDIKQKINDTELVKLLSFPTGQNPDALEKLAEEVHQNVKRNGQDAIFDYEKLSSGKIIVNQFLPHQDGLGLDKSMFKQKISETLNNLENANQENESEEKLISLELPLEVIKPDITLSETNDLGINELIGFGDSEYDHSIPNRIFNVAHTSSKMNNILLAPGQEFSFNKSLGEVSKRTGFKPAYVISNGKTVLGDGGGVCQVSTTFFRAVLNAGLPVTKRKAHSYRVSYYELNQKPGIDATVYSGDVDLRFINDTPDHILIRAAADSEDLYMKVEIYGTSDGRSTEIVDHKTWDLRPAPPSAYYETTDLPPGKIEQIDWAVSGIKASFKNIVKNKDGEVLRTEEYYSNYIPWSAKYLKGV